MMTHSVAEVMSEQVTSVPSTAPIRQAAQMMRDGNIGDVVVVDDGVVRGLLTDRDLVVRALAGGLNPDTAVVGDVYSGNLVMARPETSIDDVVRTMRSRAVRRLPVVDGEGHPVGVISIGDLAQSEDPSSALSDISKAPPNT